MAFEAHVEHGWIERIMVILGSVDHTEVQSWGISKVWDKLRKPNEDAYTPKVVSIGPLHRGISRNIQAMEEIKWSYMLSLLTRPTARPHAPTTLRTCGESIEGLDMVVRASYGVNIENEPHDLATIMLVDGCFLLEFLHRLDVYRRDPPNNPIFESEEKLTSVLSDLSLLENQLPFFVLKKLYAIIFPGENPNYDGVADLALRAFGIPSTNATRIAHLLHLIHLASVNVEGQNLPETDNAHAIDMSGETIQRQRNQYQLNRCASELIAAGITLQAEPEGHTDQWGFSFYANSRFRNERLVISPLVITEKTEAQWRNFIAWEYDTAISRQVDTAGQIKCKFISYAFLFKGLICCGHDIDVLEEKGIIVNPAQKSKQDLLVLFRKITEGVEPHMVDSSFSEMFEDLNTFPTSNRTLRVRILGSNRTLRVRILRSNWTLRVRVLAWHYGKRFVERLVEWFVTVWKFCFNRMIFEFYDIRQGSYKTYKFLKRDYHFVATLLALLSVVQTIYAVLSYHRPNN